MKLIYKFYFIYFNYLRECKNCYIKDLDSKINIKTTIIFIKKHYANKKSSNSRKSRKIYGRKKTDFNHKYA